MVLTLHTPIDLAEAERTLARCDKGFLVVDPDWMAAVVAELRSGRAAVAQLSADRAVADLSAALIDRIGR